MDFAHPLALLGIVRPGQKLRVCDERLATEADARRAGVTLADLRGQQPERDT